MCEKPGTQVCQRCNCNRYCSKECQKHDWPVHKLLCKHLKDFDVSKAPPLARRCIFFHEAGNEPVFVWLPAQITKDGAAIGDIVAACLGLDATQVSQLQETASVTFNEVLGRQHAILTRIECMVDTGNNRYTCTGQPNASLKIINEELAEAFEGPMLFHGHDRHLDTMDLRHIVDALRMEVYHVCETLGQQWVDDQPGAKVEGVRLNCAADQKILKRPEFELVRTTTAVCSYDSLQAPISDRIGIPLAISGLREEMTLPWRDRTKNPGVNMGLMVLSPGLYNSRGSMTIVRRDGKPLHVQHLAAVIQYCVALERPPAYSKNPRFKWIPEGGGESSPGFKDRLDRSMQGNAQELVRRASKQAFMAFWEAFKLERGLTGIVSPYDI
jgi:hypothetical protein